MELCTRSAVQDTFKRSFTVDTMGAMHGMKFNPIVIPDGLFVCIYGHVNRNQHD
jgi:hypothetical protein